MPRQLTLLGTIHTDPLGMKRVWNATKSIPKETLITFELEDERITSFSAEHRNFLSDWLGDLWNLEAEQKEEFEDLLKNCGYESKIALGLQLLGYKVHHIDDAAVEREGALVIIPDTKIKPKKIKEYHYVVGELYSQLRFIQDQGEREVLAICGAYILFDPQERQKIVDYQYNHGLDKVEVMPMPSTLQRDQKIEERIRKLWNESDADLLHIGGMFHLYGPYHNLYDRLQDINPTRRKLNEF